MGLVIRTEYGSINDLVRDSSASQSQSEVSRAAVIQDGIWPFFTARLPLWKRAMDLAGSLLILVLVWPLFIIIALIIKLSSPGPVFFRHLRVGSCGRLFEFIKFRTMDVHCNIARHRRYLRDLIGQCQAAQVHGLPMIKLDQCNPDIFPFGRFLRKSCLDELPQLINVLRGEMSLVGPRPPIPYEAAEYGCWHHSRFDAVPGMTGLWQVSGKNRLSFKDMVRLDIRYSQTLNPMLDLIILIMTPYVILSDFLRGCEPHACDRQGGNS